MSVDEALVSGRSPLRTTIRALRGRDASLPTTQAGAELAVMITIVGWRIGTLVQVLPAVPHGYQASQRPWLYAAVVAVVVAESVGLCAFAIVNRGFSSRRWASIDVGLAAAALMLERSYVPADFVIGTWAAWAPALAVNAVVVAALGYAKRRQVAVAAVLLALVYFAVSYPVAETATQLATVRSNTLSYLVFGVMSRAMVGFLRRFGEDADAARAQAVEAARIAELERHRRLLHDQAGLLRLLADPAIDARVGDQLRTQALAESHRLRRFLSTDETGASARDDGPMRLDDLLASVCSEFADLPVVLMTDFGGDVVLDGCQTEALRAAVATVLHNVRHHAGPVSAVVIHSDYNEGAAMWEVSIRDDGSGFDLATTRRGFGLQHVVTEGLERVGMYAEIDSAPGRGTQVLMHGRSSSR